MKVLSFIRSSEAVRDVEPPAAMRQAMGELIARLTQEGSLVDTGGLAPSQAGFKMRLAGGKLTTTDGPFSSREEILRLTTEFLELHRKYWPAFECECEVRPIEFMASDARCAK